MLPLHLSWKDQFGDTVYNGGDALLENRLETELIHGVLFPGDTGAVQTVILQNVSQQRKMLALAAGGADYAPESLINVRLYLTVPEGQLSLLEDWTAAGSGLEISLDRGASWHLFSHTYGWEKDPNTWPLLPGTAISSGAADGILAPYPPTNRAEVQLRVRMPETGTFGLYQFSLGVDCDVL